MIGTLLLSRTKATCMVFVLCLLSFVFRPLSLNAQPPSYVSTSGLVGYWPFNGNANDESGNGNNGTVNGATLTTDRFGVANKAYSFNSNYISVPHNSIFNFETNNSVTVSLWFNTTNIVGSLFVQKQSGEGVTQNGFNVGLLNVNTNLAGISQKLPGVMSLASTPSSIINVNNWYHFVYVFNNGLASLYLNGQLVHSQTDPGCTVGNSNTNLIFGYGLPSNSYYYQGKLDDIAIYNRALTQQEISNLYSSSVPPSITTTVSPSTINCGESATLLASSSSFSQPCQKADFPLSLQSGLVGYWPFCGNANDASGNGNNGSVNGATLTTDRFGNANSAYLFSTDLQSISCGTSSLYGLSSANSLSISYWTQSSVSSYPYISKYQNSIASNSNYFIGSSATENPNYIRVTANGTNSYDFLVPSTQWNHIVAVFNGVTGNVTIYVNGNLQASSNLNFASSISTQGLVFGPKLNDAYPNPNGKLDDVAIYNRALSASEIQQLYSLGNVSYAWSTGATTPSITVTPAVTSTYTCTATNASGSTTSSVTVTVADTLTWTGSYDTDWHKPCNWSPQFVPKCCNNVSVPVTTNQPIVSGVAAAEDLTIFTTNGAQVTVNNGANLQIADCPTTVTTTACPSVAVLTTTAVSGISLSSAVSGGTFTYQGASAITARGICWSTSANPTLANSFTTNGTGTGTFTSNLTGLTAGTTYYVRAYATNGSGTSYGNEISFTTPNLQMGQMYEGGVVAYIDNTGLHGFVVSEFDAGYGLWGLEGPYGAMSIYDGLANTNWMVSQFNGANLAGTICNNLVLNGYSDWYLPAQNQMALIYQNVFSAGISIMSGPYWTSTGYSSNWAMRMTTSGTFNAIAKQGGSQYIRAIRNF